MAHPKRQHSRQRQGKRRANYKAVLPNFCECPHCSKSILSHRACPFCGYYKGQPIVEIKQKKEKDKKTQ